MLFKKIKDKKIRTNFKNYENLNKINKYLNLHFLNNIKKPSYNFKIKSLVKSSSHVTKTRITRRCILTNRNRGILRPYNISRNALRELMQFSILPGYSKAVW
jgi:ribosomal protein S14